MPIHRILPGLYLGLLLGLVGFVGCGKSQTEENPAAVAKKGAPERKLNEEDAAVEDQAVPAKTPAEGTDSEEDSDASMTEGSREPAPGDNSDAATEPKGADAEAGEIEDEEDKELIKPVPLPAPENATRLSPTEEVWIKRDENKVFVDGQVALRRGMLEMFACPKGTKEHESVVSVNSKAATVHAALLAVGAVPGSPVSYDTEYHPPTGTEIGITVEWKDPQGNWHSADAREWVRNVRTEKQLDVPWVFAGSGFYVDEETKKQHYLAESGDLICVSNFSSATLDLPVESSQAEAGLLFEAFTDRVPALGTPVRLTLTPKLEPTDKKPLAVEEQK